MARKLFLHLGLHKTATSSFQNSCSRNQAELAAQGFFYPLFRCNKQDIAPFENHSIPLFSLFCSNPELYPVNLQLGLSNLTELHHLYQEQLQDALNADQQLILSAEDSTSLTTQEIHKLLEYLKGSNREIIPIAAVRQPYAYHCSQLQQQIKDGTVMTYWHHCPQRERIEKLDDIFGKTIRWINFEESCHHPEGPAAYLMETMGINIQRINFIGKNIGRCNDNIRIQNTLNRRQALIIDGKESQQHVRVAPFPGNKFQLIEEELGALSPHWEHSYQQATLRQHLKNESKVIQRILGDTWNEEELEARKSVLDENYPASTYLLLTTIGLFLQNDDKSDIHSLPIADIHQTLISSGSKLLQKLQSITYKQTEAFIGSQKPCPTTGQILNELKTCGISADAASALSSIANIWINRQSSSFQLLHP